MIPVKLTITGFLSYREPVTLDFSGFDLACISGPNGAGKSALLDAITWVLFGQARKRDESIINNHPSVGAAEVTLDFDYEGNIYRVQRTNPRGKTSSVEFLILSQTAGQEARWKPLTERTLRETDQKIQDTLRMDFDTFTNASFFLQGKADQFAVARPGERKRILSNILGLEVWEVYRDAAGRQRRDQEKQVRELEGRLSEIQSELDEGPQRKERLENLQSQLAELTKQREERAEILENVRRIHADLDEQRKILMTLRTQLENTSRSRNRTLTTLQARREEKAGYDEILTQAESIDAAYGEWQATRKALEAIEEVAEQYRQREALRQDPLHVISAEKARLTQEQKGLEEQKVILDKALTDAAELSVTLKASQDKIESTKKQLVQREKLEDDIRQLQADQAEAKAENPRLKEEMGELRERIDQLEAARDTDCPLCGQPLSEKERNDLVGELTQKGEGLRDRFYQNKELLSGFESQLKKMGARLADLKGADRELQEANRQSDQVKNQLDGLNNQKNVWEEKSAPRLAEITELLVQETFASDARERLRAIDKELVVLGYDLDAHEKLRMAEHAGREAEVSLRALEKARAALAPIEREINGLEAQLKEQEKDFESLTKDHDESAARFTAVETDLPDLALAESGLHDIQEQENRTRMTVGAARQKVAVLETLKHRKEKFMAEREQMTQRIRNLKQLERAFGKDGVPALLIEQALPEIEETTNDLLSRLTNGRMSFNFLTQREYKDSQREDLKETLDIVISDSVGVRDYEMFSGGEAFRVNFSIRLALSQVLARRAGARLQTLVIDEGFGSQDIQGRQRLVEAINLVRDDFEKILVITHLEDLQDAFPTRIEVEKTPMGSQLQVI